MGLSDEERFSKIAWTIKHLQDKTLGTGWNYTAQFQKDYPKLAKLIKRLWPDFLGRRSNSLRWFIGDELQGQSLSGNSLVSIAFEEQAPSTSKTLDDIVPQEGFYSSLRTVQNMMDMGTLVNSPAKGAVFYAYHACESIAYALHRYDDDFSKSLRQLNTTLRNMQGELFNIMSSDDDFLRAYLIHNITDKCIPYEEKDLVTQWVVKQNAHHDLRIHEKMTKEVLFHAWRKIQFRPVFTSQLDADKKEIALKSQERLEVLLKLIGRRNHYEHQHKALLGMVAEHNASFRGMDDRVDIDALKVHFNNSVKAHDEYENRGSYDSHCSLTGNYESQYGDEKKTIKNLHWEQWDETQALIEKANGDFSKLTPEERKTLYYRCEDGDAADLTEEQRAELRQMIDRDSGEVTPALRGPGYEKDREVPSGLDSKKRKAKKAKAK